MIGEDFISLESGKLKLNGECSKIAVVFINDAEVLCKLRDVGFNYTTNQWDECNRLSMRLPPPLYDLTITATLEPEYGLKGELRFVVQSVNNCRNGVTKLVDSAYETWWDSEDILGLVHNLLTEAARIHREHVEGEIAEFGRRIAATCVDQKL